MMQFGVGVGLALALAVAGVAGQTARTAQEMHRMHADPSAYMAALEDPARDGYQKPQEVVAALGLKPGEVVADIGTGTGYFAFRFAPHVAPGGRVYAVDVSPDMILHVNRRIRDLGAANVVSWLVPPDDPLLADRSVDRFFFCNVWHHIADQPAYLGRLKKMLKPGGQVVMIDFHKKPLPVGPPVEMKIAREDLVAQMKTHGFRLVQEHGFLPHQYFIVFTPVES